MVGWVGQQAPVLQSPQISAHLPPCETHWLLIFAQRMPQMGPRVTPKFCQPLPLGAEGLPLPLWGSPL